MAELTLCTQDVRKASALPKPASRLPQISSPPRPLGELQNGSMNARSGIPPPMSHKHKPSSCKSVLPMYLPEPATKVRRTLADRAGDVVNRKPTAPPSARPLSTSVKSAVTRKERGFSASTSTSMSRAGTRPASRSATTTGFSASMGPGAKPPRPRSAYGQYTGTHVRSKSHHSTARPATSLYRRDEEEDEEEERGVQPFLISTNPGESFKAPRKSRSAHQYRPHSVNIPAQQSRPLSHVRSISSPAFRPITPVQEEPTDADCEDICRSLKAFNLRASDADDHIVGLGRGISCSGEGEKPFLKPPLLSRLPHATPTRQPPLPSPTRPASTPRTSRRRFLNRFTNDQCPDFYDDRMEAMEQQFTAFKEKMETDMQKATDQKESIQQLQSRVTELEAIRARLETVNRDLETDLKDAKSCMKTMEMEMEMKNRNAAFEADDTRRKHRNEIEDLENKHSKAAHRWQSEKDAAEEKIRKNFEAQIDKLLKEHKEQLDELNAKLSKETEFERNRQLQKEQEVEAEYASKLRAANIEADAKQRELQLVQGDLTNVKSELDRERALKNALSGQLTDATTKNLTLESANTAMKEKINFLESDSQAQSSAYNDLHRRMQEAIEAAEEAHEKLRQEETLRRKLFNQVQELKGNIRVMCRVRPAHASETDPAKISFPDVDTDSKEVAIQGPEKISATGKDITASYQYSFDRVFGPKSQNLEVFDEISQLVQSALDGYNVCIFCYGQTGSGKTYTMSSADGMIPLATAQIYAEAKRLEEKGWRYKIEGSFLEVYNETYNDLLGRSEDLDKKKVEVRHDPVKKQTNLENTVSIELDGPDRVTELLKTADKNRTVAATKANMRSSRSHSVFILKLVGTNEITGERSEGTLNLVDLAGSERLEHSKVEGARLKETQNINKSLSCLGDVINALGSAKEGGHIPYRNSKLTYLLQYSLGGNSKTLMFVMVSPLQAHLQETVTSLKFATKVHNTHIGTAKKQTKTA
ncbi:P-loop containing nucleoside triphosphate hydrolase protein [Boeremia exigua]|uniref:P-loop containing nucleoside triphosphate hydrolase protein n=1 Tax=Boeremia exigua TaxID=749465 RepID=UPI001E8CAAD5|nr:P-loop containing nucleoside triphosphate hydrolase protein [Boeremia exigua]KAH6625870.1 P-loop containing nucleoside triphosphate hydrolase protein [Boeremia exigua]